MSMKETFKRWFFKKHNAKKIRRLMEESFKRWEDEIYTRGVFSSDDFRENDRKVFNMYHNSLEYLKDLGIELTVEEIFAIFPMIALLGAEKFELPSKIDDFLDYKLISFYANYNQIMQTCCTEKGEYMNPVMVIAHGMVFGNSSFQDDMVAVENHYVQPIGDDANIVEFMPVNLPYIRGSIACSAAKRQNYTHSFLRSNMDQGQVQLYSATKTLLKDDWSILARKQYYDGAIENTVELFLCSLMFAQRFMSKELSQLFAGIDLHQYKDEEKKLPIMLAVAELNEASILEEIVYDLTFTGTNENDIIKAE